MARTIQYDIKMNANQSALNELKKNLREIQNMTAGDLMSLDKSLNLTQANQKLSEVKQNATQVQEALGRAFNQKLGTTDLVKFNQELKNLDLQSIQRNLLSCGNTGRQAFRNLTTEVLTTNLQLKETHKWLDQMAVTMANTIRFGLSSSIFNNLTNGIQKAFDYSVKLDTSLNNIRIVTGKSAEEMDKFADKANKAAQNLGASTRDYTDAALIYYQQGLNDEESQARANVTVKTANVTQQSAQEVSEQLTAIWNGYKVSAEESEMYIDKVAAVAAATAADLEELSTGMSKVASAANAMGVDFDKLNAMLATVVSVTRESPETVGTSFKNIFARMSQLQTTGSDDEGVQLTKVTKQMQDLGIEILDEKGNLRDVGDTIDEVAAKWENWSKAQQVAAARVMAGTQQYSRFIALMDNQDMWRDAEEVSKNSLGALQEQQDIYMESSAAHLQQLSTAWERVMKGFSDPKSLNEMTDALTALTNGVANFIESLGGGSNALKTFGLIGLQVFKKQIAEGLVTVISNFQKTKENTKQLSAEMQILQQFKGININDAGTQRLVEMKEQLLSIGADLNAEEKAYTNELIKQTNELQKQQEEYKDKVKNASDVYSRVTGQTLTDSPETKSLDARQLAALSNPNNQQNGISTLGAKEQIQGNFDEDNKKYQDALAETEKALEKVKTAQMEVDRMKADGQQSTDDYQKAIDKLDKEQKNYLKTLDKYPLVYDEVSNSIKNVIDEQKLEPNILENLKKAYKEYNDAFSNASLAMTQHGENSQEYIDAQEEQRASFERLMAAYREATDVTVQEINTAYETLNQDTAGMTENFRTNTQNLADTWESTIARIKNTKITELVVGVVTGLGQLAQGIQTVLNLGSIWDNEDLSAGQKFLQTLMAISTATTMFGMAIGSVKKALVAMVAAQKLELGFKKEDIILTWADIASKGAWKVALEAVKLSIHKVTAALAKMWLAMGPIGWAIAAIVVAIAGLTAVVVFFANQQSEANKALAEAEERAQALAKAYEETKKAYDELKSSLEDYKNAKKALDEMVKGTDEWKEKLIEVNDLVLQLIDKYPELLQYVTTGENGELQISEEGMDTVIKEQQQKVKAAQLGNIEGKRDVSRARQDVAIEDFRKTSGHYGISALTDSQLQEFAKIVSNNQETILKGSQDDILDLFSDLANENDTFAQAVQLAGDSLVDAIKEDNDTIRDFDKSMGKYSNEVDSYTTTIASILAQDNPDYAGTTNKKGVDDYSTTAYNDKYNSEKSRLDNTEFWANDGSGVAAEWASIFLQDGQTYGTTRGDKWKNSDDSKITYKEGDVEKSITKAEMETQLAAYYAQQAGESANKIGTKYAEATEKILNAYGANNSNVGGLGEFISHVNNGDDLTKIYTKDEMETYQTAWQNFLDTAEEDVKEFTGNVLDSDEIGTKIANSIDKGLTATQLQEQKQKDFNPKAGALNKNASSLYTNIQSGDVTAENIKEDEDYQALLRQLDDLKEAYPEVTAAANILSEEWNVGSQEYLEALGQIQDKLAQAEFKDLTDKSNETTNKIREKLNSEKFDIEVGINDDEFRKNLDELLNQNYQIDVAIHTEAEQEFDDIMTAMDTIEEQASLIGENFVVSADSVRELNNVFPGILENATYAADGTIKLNQEVAQSAIDTAKTEVAADANATIDKLELQAKLLRAKQVQYQNLAEAALVLAKSEVATEDEKSDAQAKISAALGELEQLNKQAVEVQAKESDVAIADSANTNAGITAANWKEAYQKAAQYSAEFARTAAKNMQAAAGNGEATEGNFGVNYQGQSGKSSEATAIQETQDMIKNNQTGADYDKKWQDLAQQYKMMADSAGKSANDIEGMILQIGAKTHNLNNTFNNIRSGKGADGGKSGSKKDPKEEKEIKDEKDRYHDIDIILKQISTDLDRLEKQKSKLFGGNLIKNLNKQLSLIDKQIDATRTKIDIAEGEAGELRGKLSGQGVQFNADGTIANYAAAYDAQLAYVNSIIAQYNAMDAESQEAFKDTVDAAKEQFKEFTSQIDNYDKLITDTIPGLKEDIMEAVYEEIEIEVEKFNMEIEIRLDMAQAKKDWEEFEKSVILKISDKNILGNAEYAVKNQISTYYKDDGTGIIQKDTEHLNNVKAEIEKAERGEESKYSKIDPETGEFLYDQTAAMEDLDKYRNQLMSDMKEYQELVQQVRQYELDMMDKVQEGMDKQLDTYEQINSLINHDMKLIQLVYGDKAYAQMGNYYKKQNENYKAQLKVQKENKEYWEAEMDAAEKRMKADYDHMKSLEANKDSSDEAAQAYADAREAWEHSSEVFENAKDKWSTAVEDWRTTIEEALQNVIDAYVNSIEEIFQKLENEVTGGKGLDYINEEWELINKEADMYLDTINGIYNVQKLQGKYLKALDNTDSLTAQRKLNALMEEEIGYLESKEKLTQYDIDRANLKYEIALKQIALEEAQQNKSNMRLKRDSQGNYSYQFVSDEDEVGNLKDELSDLYNQLYNLTNDDLHNLMDTWLSTFQEMEDKIRDVANNTSMTYEQKQAQIALIKEHYTQIMGDLEEQYQERCQQLQQDTYLELVDFYKHDEEIFTTTLGNKFEGLETMIEQSIDSVRLGADEEISEWERMVGVNMTTIEGLGQYLNETAMPAINGYWNSGVKEMMDKVIGEGGFQKVTEGAMDSIAEKTREVQDEIEEIGRVAGISYDEIAEGKDKDIEKTEQQVDWYETLVQEYKDEYDALKDVEYELSQITLRYKEAEAAAKAAASAAYAYSQALKDQAAAEAAKDQANNNNNNNNNNNTPKSNPGGGGGGSGGGDGNLTVGDVATFTGKYYYDSYGTSPVGSRYSGVQGGIVVDKINGNPYGVHIHSSDGKYGDLGWVKKSQLSGYDTGGYTGEWGSEGRLALLHEKEIVLNAMDTENILKAVSMVRDFAGLLNQMSALSSLSTFGFGDGTAETIEQSVHIEASFPGVKESREIEMALDNLVNRASQKVHENKR